MSYDYTQEMNFIQYVHFLITQKGVEEDINLMREVMDKWNLSGIDLTSPSRSIALYKQHQRAVKKLKQMYGE